MNQNPNYNKRKHLGCFCLALLLLTTVIQSNQEILIVEAEGTETQTKIEIAYETTENYLVNTVPEPSFGSIGGEWAVIGLARGGYPLGDTYRFAYYQKIESVVKQAMQQNGTLHKYKSTEYSRLILALTAIGKDVEHVSGYNLLEGLSDMEYLKKQGINGPIWALLALDSHNYEIPVKKDVAQQTTRSGLVNYILENRQKDGGWLFGSTSLDAPSDVDMTSMAIQALAPYYEKNKAVKTAIDGALDVLSEMQGIDGGFLFQGTSCAESSAQVLVALTSLSVDPETDPRFIKNENTILSSLMSYYIIGGGFAHSRMEDGSCVVNQMATEQVFYALTAYNRYKNNQTSLYCMTDQKIETTRSKPEKTVITSISTLGSGKVKIRWNSSEDADGYILYQAASKTGNYKKIVTVKKGTTSVKTIKNRKAGKTLYFRMRAYQNTESGKVYGPFSKYVAIKVK